MSCTLANEVMHRVIERVGVRTKVMGFDNETDMVSSLAATSQSQIQTCFVHGAGKDFVSYFYKSFVAGQAIHVNVII